MTNTLLMPKSTTHAPPLQRYTKDTLIKGQPATIDCLNISGQTYAITKGPLSVVGLEDEWYEDVQDPEATVAMLKSAVGFKPDIFTFWQRVPDSEPKYPFHFEWEELAVL